MIIGFSASLKGVEKRVCSILRLKTSEIIKCETQQPLITEEVMYIDTPKEI